MRQEILRIEDFCAETDQGLKLSHINLSIFKGETVALMGLSGSGESELIEALCGNFPISNGKIYINEKPISLFNEKIACRNGVYKISRKSSLIDNLTIAENIFIIRNNSFKKLFIQQKLIYSQTIKLLDSIGLMVDPNTYVRKLSRSEKHLIELIKAVSSGANIVIFEKNFSSYSTDELISLQEILMHLKKKGVSFIICCDYIEEARLLSEKVIFFRDGQISKKINTLKLKNDTIADYMIGYSPKTQEREYSSVTENVAFEVGNLVLNESAPAISFNVKHGETVALIDMDTKEKEKLFSLLSGKEKQNDMSLHLNGELLSYKNIYELLEKKVVSIRSLGIDGELLRNLSVEENIILPSLKKASGIIGFVSSKLTKFKTIGIANKSLLNKRNVREIDRNGRIAVILERWYIYHPHVVVMLEPFLLCDLVGENLINDFIRRLAKEGTAIILIAARTSKIEDKCDRILTLQNGKLLSRNKLIEPVNNLTVEDAVR